MPPASSCVMLRQSRCRISTQHSRENCGVSRENGYAARNPLRVPLLKLIFREVVAERALADAHEVGGVLLDPAGAVERAADRLLFNPLDVRAQLERGQRVRLSGRDA